MSKSYKLYTNDDIREAVKISTSLASVLRKLGLKAAGGNYLTIKMAIGRLNLDTSHFKGYAWNKDLYKEFDGVRSVNSKKRILIEEAGHKCWKCNLSLWMGRPIPLEIDHIDGDRLNNVRSNLRILCPNCHAFTDTYRGKNISSG